MRREQSPYIGVPKITAPYEGDNKVKAGVHFNEMPEREIKLS